MPREEIRGPYVAQTSAAPTLFSQSVRYSIPSWPCTQRRGARPEIDDAAADNKGRNIMRSAFDDNSNKADSADNPDTVSMTHPFNDGRSELDMNQST